MLRVKQELGVVGVRPSSIVICSSFSLYLECSVVKARMKCKKWYNRIQYVLVRPGSLTVLTVTVIEFMDILVTAPVLSINVAIVAIECSSSSK